MLGRSNHLRAATRGVGLLILLFSRGTMLTTTDMAYRNRGKTPLQTLLSEYIYPHSIIGENGRK